MLHCKSLVIVETKGHGQFLLSTSPLQRPMNHLYTVYGVDESLHQWRLINMIFSRIYEPCYAWTEYRCTVHSLSARNRLVINDSDLTRTALQRLNAAMVDGD